MLIPVYFEPFSTLHKQAWAGRFWQSGRSCMAFWLSKPTQISLPPPSNHQLGIPSSSIKCCSKCFWYDGYVLSVLKPFFEAFLHVLRRTILGHICALTFCAASWSFWVKAVFLGQGCLFHVLLAQHPSVSPGRLLYGLPKDRRLSVARFVRLCGLNSHWILILLMF